MWISKKEEKNIAYIVLAVLGFFLLWMCSSGSGDVDPKKNIPSNAVEIELWTNDTKAEWVHAVTAPFNDARVETSSGRPVFVHVNQLSSGDVFPKISSGELKPTIWSPAT